MAVLLFSSLLLTYLIPLLFSSLVFSFLILSRFSSLHLPHTSYLLCPPFTTVGADRAFKKRSDEVLETLTEMVGRATDIQVRHVYTAPTVRAVRAERTLQTVL